MIRGVNRQIIEINQTDHPSFERVLLFVSPSCAQADENKLRQEAGQLIAGLSRPPRSRKAVLAARQKARKEQRVRRIAWAAVWTCIGAGLMALLQWLI